MRLHSTTVTDALRASPITRIVVRDALAHVLVTMTYHQPASSIPIAAIESLARKCAGVGGHSTRSLFVEVVDVRPASTGATQTELDLDAHA